MKKITIKIGLILLLSAVFISCNKDDIPKDPVTANTLIGNWRVTGTLVTTTNTAPNSPQPGFQAMDYWEIRLENNVPVLKTSKGTVNGSVVGKGYHFEGQFDVAAGYVWCTFVIEVTPSVQAGKMYGTEEFKYFGLNGVGQPMFLGTESWKLDGDKL